MRQFLLLRHAKSSWDDPQLSDHARPLNARGRQAAAAMRDAMRALTLRPELVLVSSARRTLQTLEALSPWDRPPAVLPLDALYLAPVAAMLEVLRRIEPTVRCAMLIAHNPGVHELALALADPDGGDAAGRRRLAEAYPTGALAEFAVPGEWEGLDRGDASLTRFLAPRDLPQLAA